MTSLQLPVFDDTRDKWKAYLIRAEAYFEANAITDSKRQRALLVAALSTQTVQVLAGIIAPRMPNSLTYAEAVAALNDYYDPKRHEIAESYKFFTRCQQGESVHAFLVEIRRIADNCNFGSALARMLRDRIVCGVRSTNLRKQLLAKKDLTLEEAETMAIAAEATDSDAKDMSAEPPTVLKMQAHHRSPSRGNRTRGASHDCGRCGSTKHDGNSCRWDNARCYCCYRCGRRGHLAKKCCSASTDARVERRAASVKALTVESASINDDMDNAHMWTLILGRKNGLEPPIRRRTFRWGDVELAMEVDTGSPVCVISRQVYDRHHAQSPRLQPPRIKLSCYAGQLPVLGELELPVKYKNVSVPCPLIVLDCAGPSLCGRDLIASLDKTGVPIGDLTAPNLTTSAEPSDNMLNRLLGEFEDVFSTDLGLIKGPPASLKLKETATPKFCLQITLVTDHQPLLGLLKPDRPTPPMAAARIKRWALFLGGYQYKLQYVPGKQLLTADALSRLPAPRAAEPVAEGDPPEYVLSLEALDEGGLRKRKESHPRKCFSATSSVPVLTHACRPRMRTCRRALTTGQSHQAAASTCGTTASAKEGRLDV
ncbi:uncharacterized protein LOC144155199 isoform X2 [Haemaphysalis longicornis]